MKEVGAIIVIMLFPPTAPAPVSESRTIRCRSHHSEAARVFQVDVSISPSVITIIAGAQYFLVVGISVTC